MTAIYAVNAARPASWRRRAAFTRQAADTARHVGDAALLCGGLTLAAVRAWPWLMGRASAWSVDVALALVVAGGERRSPFYLLAVSALIAPATTLPSAAAIAVGAGFTTVYFALALTLGIEWDALASTARLESFWTYLLRP